MAQINQVVCDVCGAVKGPGNQWIKYTNLAGFTTFNRSDSAKLTTYTEGMKDACSDACLLKALNRYMDAGNYRPSVQPNVLVIAGSKVN